MATTTDYYELLGVDRSADEKALKSAYRKLAMQCHPDRNPGDAEAEAKFKELSQAYDCLKDPQKRATYDHYGREAYENGGMGNAGGGGGHQGFGDFSDIFNQFFGEGGMGGGGQRGPARGADLRYDMEITLEDAYHGKSTEIKIDVAVLCDPCAGSGAQPGSDVKRCGTCQGHGKVRAQQGFFVVERTCPSCQGRGEVIAEPCHTCQGDGRMDQQKTLEVEIPPGVDDGTRIRLASKGEAGANGAPAGDLYIFLHVKRHKYFQREGTTLFAQAPISFTKAALGGSITIPGMDGVEHEISIPAGIQSGKQLQKRGAGMPVLQGRGKGDLVVQIDVETPTSLTSKQKELLREFQETETGKETPNSQGFFDKIKEAWEDLTD